MLTGFFYFQINFLLATELSSDTARQLDSCEGVTPMKEGTFCSSRTFSKVVDLLEFCIDLKFGSVGTYRRMRVRLTKRQMNPSPRH